MSDRGVFLSWVRSHGRSHDLALALGLRELNYSRRIADLPRAVRYLAGAVANGWVLLRERPSAVMVMSPPPFPVFIAAAYCLVTGRPLVIDAHSGAFNRPAWRRLSRLSMRLADQCRRSAVVVTNDEMRADAETWVRMPVVQLHDLLERIEPPPGGVLACDVFIVSSWSDDEPLDTVAQAMPYLDGLRVVISGRPPSDAEQRPLEEAGVVVPGFLSTEDYHRTLAGAGVVVALTTRAGTMQRGGYEAASAGKALVTSDSAVLRDYFGGAAVYAANDPGSLAASVRAALGRRRELESAMLALRERRLAEQEAGLKTLQTLLHP